MREIGKRFAVLMLAVATMFFMVACELDSGGDSDAADAGGGGDTGRGCGSDGFCNSSCADDPDCTTTCDCDDTSGGICDADSGGSECTCDPDCAGQITSCTRDTYCDTNCTSDPDCECNCDYYDGICEAAARNSQTPCACDSDCGTGDEPCTDDGHCDSWCPSEEDPDCDDCDCDYYDDICEAEEDGTDVECDCDPTCAEDANRVACEADGHCDTWCEVNGQCKDPDCNDAGESECERDDD